MHSAQWDHDYPLAGKRVASIGTGASAIQYVPAIQEEVEKLYVFQRTAPWIMPHGSAVRSPPRERSLFRRFPAVQRAIRSAVYLSKEVLVLGFVKQPRLLGALERLAGSHMRKQVSDPRLLAKVAPDYTIGCKRILPSNRWYPALQQPNVEARDGRPQGGPPKLGHRCRRAASTRSTRSSSAPASTSATRLSPTRCAGATAAPDARGPGEGTPRASTSAPSVPGFPNMFLLLGPNTGLGHSSMVLMIETQIEHVLQADQSAMDRRAASTIEVREEVYEEFNRDIGRAHAEDGLGERLLELLPGRDRPQRHALARLDLALLAARSQLQRGRPMPSRARARSRCRHDRGQARDHHHRRRQRHRGGDDGRASSAAACAR